MRLLFACLLSLGAHLVLLFAPVWLSATPAPLRPAIEATLRHMPAALGIMADAVTSIETDKANNKPDSPLASAPKNLRGTSLRRAQGMLSKHLFYPPPAVAQELEGEVVLLLTLDAAGQIHALDIAKSSGHALLDEAALNAARHIGALPGNPRQTLLPITFRLQ